METPHVVIVGAGFGGLAAARELADAPVRVTLVDRNNFHTFQPLLYQVATSGLASADVAHPVRGIVGRRRGQAFRQATVIGADLDAKVLRLEHPDHEVADLAYDHLIVAAGAVTNTFAIPGVEEHGFPLYRLDEAVALRNHVLERFEAADADPALIDDGALTFVVVGGGPTGVEVAGALAELFDLVLRKDFPHLPVRDRARVVLVEREGALLGPFGARSQAHARQTLIERGVEVRTDTSVARVEATRVSFSDGEDLAAHTLVWAAGVQANPLGQVLGLPTGRGGRIEVAPNLAVDGTPGVWAIGDIAGTDLAQLAPVAMQGGRHVARQIAGRIGPEPFRYRDKGTMATIGRSRAVAELPFGIALQGLPAWLAWLGLHLIMLAGFRNRLSVFANWAWNWFTYDRGPRLIFGQARPRMRSTAISMATRSSRSPG
jgi:NADH dehydrogenase